MFRFTERMTTVTLMSENDWHSIEVSFCKRREIVLYRERPGVEYLEVRTETVSSRAWDAEMLIGVIYRRGGMLERQWLATVEEAKAAVARFTR